MYVHSLDYEKIIAVPVYTGHQSCNFSNYSNSFIAHCSWNCLINNFDWSTIYSVIVSRERVIVSREREEAVLLTKLINICFLIAPMNCVFLNSNLVGLGQWIKCIVDYVYIPRSKKAWNGCTDQWMKMLNILHKSSSTDKQDDERTQSYLEGSAGLLLNTTSIITGH